ncbi:tetratricopeptide repeat protein [Hufsiella ginkgonis]|uniref:Tetratricopeptide repeat protein n=1 Tax=Hufsiella ginkgonis TaxID=2695274 RepID=A0A7K1XX51_9SPHI|nr:tetratricopeptide repeat protein [Hufsiella ginkgonis]MXV15575.1 tetratricopeptide repeat protein [Hufsiella ginkgonis]
MKIFNFLVFLFLICTSSTGYGSSVAYEGTKEDTSRVIELNILGNNSRLTDPQQTLEYANLALALARKLNYDNGIAEAYRVKGIGNYYKFQTDSAVQNYLESLNYFSRSGNLGGQAKVYNNIGNLYLTMTKDYGNALTYFRKAFVIAKKLNLQSLIAGLYLNIASTYQRQNFYTKSLEYYGKSYALFTELKITTGITQCLQNLSAVHKKLGHLETAEKYALEAIEKAKAVDENFTVASTNLTLSGIYVTMGKYREAQKAIDEGREYAGTDKNFKRDFLVISYTLESKRNNYKKAFEYLQQVYKEESELYSNDASEKYKLQEAKNKQEQIQKENELTIERQKNNILFVWASVIVSVLLVVVIVLLTGNVRKKAKTNKQLTALNLEISTQKENLDRINHNLEEIIDERTRDLKIKNKKLSEYSSHLSHQIRGPVATLKGLMNLDKEGLIDKDEVIQQMEKCVNDIDDKILHINDMLHDPHKYGFKSELHKDL